MSRSNTSHWQREEQEIEGDFAIFKSPVDIEPSYPEDWVSWYLRPPPSTLDWPPWGGSLEQWQTELAFVPLGTYSLKLQTELVAPNPYSEDIPYQELDPRDYAWFQDSPDEFANACAETPPIDSNILDPTPPSQDLPPLHFHFRSNQHRPRLLLFNHLSKLWLPLRQDRFLVLLSYLLGGTGLGTCRGILCFVQCRHVPRTVPFRVGPTEKRLPRVLCRFPLWDST
jgi:hypothetical protein